MSGPPLPSSLDQAALTGRVCKAGSGRFFWSCRDEARERVPCERCGKLAYQDPPCEVRDGAGNLLRVEQKAVCAGCLSQDASWRGHRARGHPTPCACGCGLNAHPSHPYRKGHGPEKREEDPMPADLYSCPCGKPRAKGTGELCSECYVYALAGKPRWNGVLKNADGTFVDLHANPEIAEAFERHSRPQTATAEREEDPMIIEELQAPEASAQIDDRPACPCGCGRPVNPGRTYASPGCATRGKQCKPSPETRARMSAAAKARIARDGFVKPGQPAPAEEKPEMRLSYDATNYVDRQPRAYQLDVSAVELDPQEQAASRAVHWLRRLRSDDARAAAFRLACELGEVACG